MFVLCTGVLCGVRIVVLVGLRIGVLRGRHGTRQQVLTLHKLGNSGRSGPIVDSKRVSKQPHGRQNLLELHRFVPFMETTHDLRLTDLHSYK